MKLVINGKDYVFEHDSLDLLSLLEIIDTNADTVVAEVNGEIIQGDYFGETALNDGTRVELINIVGGG
ncbi:MAG: sulfur carrier protein ThiS [Oligoflexia bacterium]|nr:sulfur carrier protein ThiS [Oligoflexia bacterium]